MIPDPERFDIIKKVFKTYLTGEYSIPELTHILNVDWHYKSKKRRKIG